MNETNLPEKQLRSWTPRRPSAALKRKLFAAPETVSPQAVRWYWGALAPTMACVLLTLLTFGQGRDGLGRAPLMATTFSNESGAVCAVDDSQTAQNHWASVTFDWTNRSDFKSSMRFQPITNFSN